MAAEGTGRARHGSIRSPLWVGGGVVFGPKPRAYDKKVPRKVKKLALRSYLNPQTGDRKPHCSGGTEIRQTKNQSDG